jgi:hypothetical protein
MKDVIQCTSSRLKSGSSPLWTPAPDRSPGQAAGMTHERPCAPDIRPLSPLWNSRCLSFLVLSAIGLHHPLEALDIGRFQSQRPPFLRWEMITERSSLHLPEYAQRYAIRPLVSDGNSGGSISRIVVVREPIAALPVPLEHVLLVERDTWLEYVHEREAPVGNGSLNDV